MLVLTRKLNEEIVVSTPEGDHVVIKVLKLHSGEVRLGIDAARDIKIMRREIMDDTRSLD